MGASQMNEQQRQLFSGRWQNVVIPNRKEIELHIQLVSMLGWCLKPNVIYRHYPAGELRDKRSAGKLKAMGVLPGSADLEFFWDGGTDGFRALFLEFKRPGGKLSVEQAAFGLAMR